MSQVTKHALEAALKDLLKDRPLDKITIADITGRCGINRMTFYYHFKDIYDLVEWICEEEAQRAIADNRTYDSWQEGYLQIFELVKANRAFIFNVYRSVNREQVESYLYRVTYKLLAGVVDELSAGMTLREADKAFVTDLYKYALVGLLLDWVKNGLKEDPAHIVSQLETAIHGNLLRALEAFRVDK